MKYDDNELRPVKKRRPVEDAADSSRDAAPRASRPVKKRPASADEPRPASRASGTSGMPRKRQPEEGVPAKRRVPRELDAASYRSAADDGRPRTTSRAKSSSRPVGDPYDLPPRKRARTRDADYLYADDEYELRPPRSASQKKRQKGRKKNKPERSGFFNTLFYCVIAVLLALVISLVLKSSVLEVVRVTGDSMYKALSEGDVVLCTKFDYKSRNTNPERYSVVLVHGQSGVMFRRVVGLPGETVEIADTGDVIINSLALPEGYVEVPNFNPSPEITLDMARYYVLCDNRSVTADSREFGPVTKDQLSRARFVIWPLSRIGQIKANG